MEILSLLFYSLARHYLRIEHFTFLDWIIAHKQKLWYGGFLLYFRQYLTSSIILFHLLSNYAILHLPAWFKAQKISFYPLADSGFLHSEEKLYPATQKWLLQDQPTAGSIFLLTLYCPITLGLTISEYGVLKIDCIMHSNMFVLDFFAYRTSKRSFPRLSSILQM